MGSLTLPSHQDLQGQGVDVSTITNVLFRDEEPHIDGSWDVLAEVLVGTVIITNALWLTALSVLVAVEGGLEEEVEGWQDLHDGKHLTAGEAGRQADRQCS